MDKNNSNELLFMQLVMQNQQLAMMSMGKLKNPVSDKIERNLEFAKMAIDTLDMLAVKTKGNLSEYEEKFLTEVIKDLKLNYVDEANKEQKKDDNGKETKSDNSSKESNPENK
jgi:hypothetical protein